ncbi:hypothetical protein Avbf_18397 [Armadillidium vulgare]|nr:hypothetical protein Avbf_18397 [Armadillidium vulgare]
MLKEPHNLQRKHRSKGPLNRSLNDWKISDLLHALKETFSSRRDLAINEDEDNHPEYLHHPQTLLKKSWQKKISQICASA